MEADQNQEVPEGVTQTHVEETALEQPMSELVIDTPSPSAEDPIPEVESTEQTPLEEPAKEDVSPEAAAEPEKTEVAEEVPEKVEVVEESANEPAEVEKQPEIEAVTAPEEPKEEPAESEPPAVNEAEEAEAKPDEAQNVQAEEQPKEPELPLFYGWFLLSEVEGKIKCSTSEFLKTLDTLEAFKKHIGDFTGDAEKEVDLEQYFQPNVLPLHCTTMFCDYGKVEGAKEYAELQVVKDSSDTTTELSVVGLIVTPRTFGARLSLTTEQLTLWPTGADKLGVPEAERPAVEALSAGSRAHVTLGCAQNVEAVQTGLDLLEILVCMQGEEKPATTEELELGTLSYLGKGRWYLALREPVTCDATFSSFSEEQRPAEPVKKESGEKKKKPKCSIL